MGSHKYLTCLFLLTASLTDLSQAGCNDYFKPSAWKVNLKTELKALETNFSIQMDRDPKDIMNCSVKNTFLSSCIEGTCERTNSSTMTVPFYHLMCLTDISRNQSEKEKPEHKPADMCQVYEKVCRQFVESSFSSAPPTTTTAVPSTTPTIAGNPTNTASVSPAMPTSTSSTATTVQRAAATAVPSTTTTIAGNPTNTTSVSPAMPTSTSSTATTTVQRAAATAVPSTTPTTAGTRTTSPTTETPTTESVTRKIPTTSPTKPTTTTAQQSAPTASAQSDTRSGGHVTSETEIYKQLVIFLLFTNVLSPLAVYVFMRRQRNRQNSQEVNQNMLDEEQTTMIQLKSVVQNKNNEEDVVLLKMQDSVIINPPETTQTESPRQNGLED